MANKFFQGYDKYYYSSDGSQIPVELERIFVKMGGNSTGLTSKAIYSKVQSYYDNYIEVQKSTEPYVTAEFDLNKLIHFVERYDAWHREIDELYLEREGNRIQQQKLKEIINSNQACQKAWNNFVSAVKLVSDDTELMKKLDDKGPL